MVAVGNLFEQATEHPKSALCILFVLYKSLLLCIAFSCPGAFDTSTSLSGWPDGGVLSKLISWDALWFTNVAQRGYRWEQDWAWGWGYTRLLSLGRYLSSHASYEESVQREAILGIVLSHVCHLLTVLLVWRIGLLVFRAHDKGERIAFVAGCLHIVSQAGLFLSSAYTESPFAFLKFTAYYFYAKSSLDDEAGDHSQRDIKVLLSGALIGSSCMVRSNGLLSGLIFLLDAVIAGVNFLSSRGSFVYLRKGFVICVAGLLIAAGQVYPQYLAYNEFCTSRNPGEKRPWCSAFPPSIYSYVQEHYWDVGPFRYWKAKQIPLFILAAPTLYILFKSSLWAWNVFRSSPSRPMEECVPLTSSSPPSSPLQSPSSPQLMTIRSSETVDRQLLLRFMIPQLLVAILAVFVFHVQVVARMASGYPVWYWWLATCIVDQATRSEDSKLSKSREPLILSRWMVMYGIIQAGLFACFLPPA